MKGGSVGGGLSRVGCRYISRMLGDIGNSRFNQSTQ